MKILQINTLNTNPAFTKSAAPAKIASGLEKRLLESSKKSDDIKFLYSNGINFLKGDIDKISYLTNLDKNLKNLYDSKKYIELSKKENYFFNNMFTTFDSVESIAKIPEKYIKDCLEKLSKKR